MPHSFAQVVELVDTPDLGSGVARRGGSSPLLGKLTESLVREVPFFLAKHLIDKKVMYMLLCIHKEGLYASYLNYASKGAQI